ncbi:MAG: exosome complex protein Rrp42 [Candidatus Aenigmarchaeota archaeon]|nr:exosome complex protein Rrp42 [Candidatus Aenigmarchaeota archaeon]
MKILQQSIVSLAAKGMRLDGRKLDQIRDIVIEASPIEKAEGSAIVKLGRTKVIAGVKIGVGQPFSDRPGSGVLMTGAEFSPISSPDFEPGPPRDNSIELARVVDRGIRESQAIDLDKLCIEPGEKVWMVFVDINILDNFGNLIDAAALASAVALSRAVFPKYEDGAVIFTEKTKKKLPVACLPIACTSFKVGERLLLDATREEEEAAGARITVTTRDDGNVAAIQKGGEEGITPAEIEHALDMAVEKGKEIRKLVKQA